MITTPDPMDVALGRVVREMRKRKKISQTALGAALGISFQQIQKYERELTGSASRSSSRSQGR
jgi:transcriptional regulator with XRE-family HTH domain